MVSDLFKKLHLLIYARMWLQTYSIFQPSLWMEKVGEKQGKLQKVQYLENEMSILG